MTDGPLGSGWSAGCVEGSWKCDTIHLCGIIDPSKSECILSMTMGRPLMALEAVAKKVAKEMMDIRRAINTIEGIVCFRISGENQSMLKEID